MRTFTRVADALDALVRVTAQWAAWLLFAMVGAICLDVITRKFNLRVPYFDSTKLQELEWHLHGILFLACLGYGYIRNAHVRIDVASAYFNYRARAWVELFGCVLLAIPFCVAIIYIGVGFFYQAYVLGESSESPTGLPYRWIIKAAIPIGMILLLASVVSTALRQATFLFGSSSTVRTETM
jgi:TRAP-type mannitol/chloroaromatic compound transport system permease small subunit